MSDIQTIWGRELIQLAKDHGIRSDTRDFDSDGNATPRSPLTVARGIAARALPLRMPDDIGFERYKNTKDALAIIVTQDCGAPLDKVLELLRVCGFAGFNENYLGAIVRLNDCKAIFKDLTEDCSPLPWRPAARVVNPRKKKA